MKQEIKNQILSNIGEALQEYEVKYRYEIYKEQLVLLINNYVVIIDITTPLNKIKEFFKSARATTWAGAFLEVL
jgi:hypothetical protein